MFSVYLAARLLGRQRSVLPPLALAAMIMLAIDPAIVSSISFQLSFAALLGIALLSARFAVRGSDWIQSSVRIPTITKRLLTGVVYGMSVSLAATIATAPLVAFHLGEIPLWGIPSTLLIVPVLPLFLGEAVLTAVASFDFGQPVKSTVLKVGHHGSRTSTTERFLDAVDPAVAIVTTGIKNQFGHPHKDMIERLQRSLSEEAVFVTRARGTVSVITDGTAVWVESER